MLSLSIHHRPATVGGRGRSRVPAAAPRRPRVPAARAEPSEGGRGVGVDVDVVDAPPTKRTAKKTMPSSPSSSSSSTVAAPGSSDCLPPFAKRLDASGDTSTWVSMGVSVLVEPLDGGEPRLLMALVAEQTGLVTPWVEVAGARSRLRKSDFDDGFAPGVEDASQVGQRLLKGTRLAGSISVPPDFGPVGAVLLRAEDEDSDEDGGDDKEGGRRKGKKRGAGQSDAPAIYVADVKLDIPGEKPANADDVHVRSFLMPPQGTRVFFSRRASIPQAAPAALAPYREGDLAVLRGDYVALDAPDVVPQPPFRSHDRVYSYDVYNDLAGPKDATQPRTRPTLGGEGQIPYPRRLRTGRAVTPSGEEVAPDGEPYLPRNEQFTKKAAQDFTVAAGIGTVAGVLKARKAGEWKDFAEAVDFFKDGSLLQKLLKAIRKLLVKDDGVVWSMPRVLDGRLEAWKDDAEFGRQVVGGLNPVTVLAATRARLALTSFWSPAGQQRLGPEQLGGATLEELLVAGERDPVRGQRLFLLDFATSTILEYAERVNASEKSGRARLVGTRCLMLAGADRVLRPVAIELVRSRSEPSPQIVTPADGEALWLLAKMYVGSSDSGHHQLISHWLRSHACTEPYIIAAKRTLSQAHPLMRFLSKHFYYTLQINAKARGGLINAGGVVEIAFTPGAQCLELSAAAYRDGWSFEGEALPADLVARGMAVGDASPGGAGVSLLQTVDYPYAQDGLDLWRIIEDWSFEFCALYYPDDAAVASDPELSRFWQEVTTVGHGDIERGWPALTSVRSLAHILTTIVYIVSAHHAAVNFGQYDFAGTLLNRSSRTRLDFPRGPGDKAWERLACPPGESISREQEGFIMEHMSDPYGYSRNAAVVNVLSTHDQQEHYIGAPDPWMVDPATPALERLYAKFNLELGQHAKTVGARNADRNNAARCGNGVLDYRLLLPTSPPGMTSQGVPNSVSI